MESQPASAVPARPSANSVESSLISNLMSLILRRRLGLQHIIKDGDGAQGDRQVGNIEDIPVITEAVKVEKVRHLAIDQAVDQVPKRAADDQPEACGQGFAGGAPKPPG